MTFVQKLKAYLGIKWRLVFVSLPRVLKYRLLSTNAVVGKNNIYNQPVLAMGLGTISAENVNFGVYQSPKFYNTYQYIDARSSDASIHIGSGTWINNNAMICADKTSITIGENCLIGTNFICVDSNFHGLEAENRLNGKYDCNPVKLECNVFIGANVTVLKGVTIGENSVIGAGSVVVASIPRNVIASGNPAKVLRKLS